MLLAPDVKIIHDDLSEPFQEIFDAIVSVAYQVNPAFQNRIQWRVPTFTLNDNWHHWIFSLARTKLGMTITFHKGWLLEDPEKILSGDGKHVRMLRFTEAGVIPKNSLEGILRSAVQHQVDM